jgi:nucleotide-binding universal stress UspA family protein
VIPLIVLPLIKCSRRIRPIVSTVSIPPHRGVRPKGWTGLGGSFDRLPFCPGTLEAIPELWFVRYCATSRSARHRNRISRDRISRHDTTRCRRDESPECWHAVSAAIPFMQLAKLVRVISVDRDASSRQASQAEVLAYLRCHGIAATGQVVAPELRSVGDTLLAAAAEHDAGLLVMGAYSHSRLRELLLGGATRHILKNASARPVLLAH